MCCPSLKLFLTYKGEEEHINAVLGIVVPRDRVSILAFALIRATVPDAGTLDKQLNPRVHDEMYVLK